MNQLSKFKIQLDSLHEALMGIMAVYYFLVPNNEYEKTDPHFILTTNEAIKLVTGRIITLINDKKARKFSTISFKILIEDIISNISQLDDMDNKLDCFKDLLKIIDTIDDKYKMFRDKVAFHIELGDHNKLKGYKDYSISNNGITKLLDTAIYLYDRLFFLLADSGTDHMKEDLEKLSSRVWEAYEKLGIVRRNNLTPE